MKRLPPLLVLLFALVASGCEISKRSVRLAVPADSLPGRTVDLPHYEEQYGEYDGVYLDLDHTFDHVARSAPLLTWNYFEVVRRSYVVLDPEAEWLTTFSHVVPPTTRLEAVYLRVTSPDGAVTIYRMDDLKRETNSGGGHVYKFIYPDVKKGTVIEEGYEMRYTDLFDYPQLDLEVPLQFNIPCEQLSLRYAFPDWWTIQTKEIAAGRQLPYRIDHHPDDNKRILTYEASDVEAIREEPFAPFFKEVADYLALSITKMYVGPLRYQAPSEWSEVTGSFKYFAMQNSPFLSTRVEHAAEEAVEGAESDHEKVEAVLGYLYKHVQSDWTSDASDFGEVLAQGRGNPYLVTGLMQSLLVRAGVSSRYLLIHSAEDGHFDRSYINRRELYVPGLRIDTEAGTFHAFPYLRNLPLEHLPQSFQGQPALAITDVGYDQFVELPYGNAADNVTSEDYTLTIGEGGVVTVEEVKTLRGSGAYVVRDLFAELEQEELEETLKELLTYSDGEVTWISREVIDQETYDEPLRIELTYSINNLVTLTPEEIIFQTGGLFAPLSGTTHKIDTDERQNPIRIYYDERQEKNIAINYPAHWTPTTPLEDVRYRNRFGSLRGTYAVAPGRIEVDQQVVLEQSAEDPDKIGELIALVGGQSRLHIPTIIFSTTSSAAR